MSCFVLKDLDPVVSPEPEPVSPRVEILIATTWECNLKCSYCFVSRRGLTASQQRMTPELAVRVVDALDKGLKHIETISLHFYGGEPLMNLSAMSAMLARAKDAYPGRFRFSITTNGVNDSPEVFDILREGNFQVVLSIDGPAEIHDACRRTTSGRPTHAAVMRFLKLLHSRTPCRVRASSVVRSGWSLDQASTYLRSLPIDVIKAQAVRLPSKLKYSLNKKEKRTYLNDLDKIGSTVIAELEAGKIPRDDRFSARVLQLLQGTDRSFFCGAGETVFGIMPDGTVLPCVLLEAGSNRLGHIDDDTASWVTAGRRWRSERRLKTECKSCPAFSLCGGGCPAILPVCGDDECDIIRKNCEVARRIYSHFRENPTSLLALAGIV
jgi:uncharacterized protein